MTKSVGTTTNQVLQLDFENVGIITNSNYKKERLKIYNVTKSVRTTTNQVLRLDFENVGTITNSNYKKERLKNL
ncbi:hypothetical protein LEP1GSC037_4296 [Leptospira interrogans str. 2006001854]|uniref:Uncharacterized protein n=1 Tax=Leptospira interrogans str. 2006001854 TaxID=1001590 RepID=M6GPZ9_LEPIR|nr:hypothetical protein LEP1GSC037_4296 [Leptospira interrogans str. 2006001854]